MLPQQQPILRHQRQRLLLIAFLASPFPPSVLSCSMGWRNMPWLATSVRHCYLPEVYRSLVLQLVEEKNRCYFDLHLLPPLLLVPLLWLEREVMVVLPPLHCCFRCYCSRYCCFLLLVVLMAVLWLQPACWLRHLDLPHQFHHCLGCWRIDSGIQTGRLLHWHML